MDKKADKHVKELAKSLCKDCKPVIKEIAHRVFELGRKEGAQGVVDALNRYNLDGSSGRSDERTNTRTD